MNNIIPKKIHISWVDKNLLNNDCFLLEIGIKNLISNNPNWSLQISDDNDVEQYLKKNICSEFYSLLKDQHIVAKLDVWRLVKIYNEGGLYIDIDRICDVKLDNVIEKHVKWVLPTNGNYDFSQDILLSSPSNPIFFETLEAMFQRRKLGYKDIYFLGAQTYMHAITKCLFDEVIHTDPGDEVFEAIRKNLDQIPFIQHFKEQLPNYTFLNRQQKITHEEWSIYKKHLYKKFNLKHWTNNW